MNEAKKDIDITPEELGRIENALRDEKFRKMFFDYCQEISDPVNRAKYELEIQQLEKQRGFDVTFLKPEAGHVIKAIDTKKNEKVFINVGTNENVEDAKADKGQKDDGKRLIRGENWTIPHMLNPPRADVDNAGKECRVCDVMFHSDVYTRAIKQKDMMKMLNSIAIETAEEKFGFEFDRNNIKYPKLKFKGKAESTLLRNKDGNNAEVKVDEYMANFVKYPEMTAPLNWEGKAKEKEMKSEKIGKIDEMNLETAQNGKTVPRYKILHRGHFDMQNFTLERSNIISTRPAELCIEIELPAMKSADGVDLDVFEKRLVLTSQKPNYNLELNLPYHVDEDHGTAKFDKNRRILIVTLPVIDREPDITKEMAKEEAGIENGFAHKEEEVIEFDRSSADEVDTSKQEDCQTGPTLASSCSQEAVFASPNLTSAEDSKDPNTHDCGQELASANPLLTSGEDSKNLGSNVCNQEAICTNLYLDGEKEVGSSTEVTVPGEDVILIEEIKNSSGDTNEVSEFLRSDKNSCRCTRPVIEQAATESFVGEQISQEYCAPCENNKFKAIKGVGDIICLNMDENKNSEVVSGNERTADGAFSLSKDIFHNASTDEIVNKYNSAEETSMDKGNTQGVVNAIDPHTKNTEAKDTVFSNKGTLEREAFGEHHLVEERMDSEENLEARMHGNRINSDAGLVEDLVAVIADDDESLMIMKPPCNGNHEQISGEVDHDELLFKRDDDNLKNKVAGCFEEMTEDQLDTMNFCFEGLADVSGMNKLPPYDYDQDEESVTVNINLPNVKVEDMSLGFSTRKVYFSVKSSNDSEDPTRWCLLIKFLEYCRLDKDFCSVDITEERVVLTLPKSEASYGLWHRLYIGTSENSLKELFFMTDHSMSELLGRLHKEENPWAKQPVNAAPEIPDESSAIIERKLEQLLREQEMKLADESTDAIDLERTTDKDVNESGITCVNKETDVKENMLKSLKSKKKQERKETTSTSSDITIDVTLDELQNDVILECTSSFDGPECLSRQPVERSHSDESALSSYPKLRSILKRSQSESANAECADVDTIDNYDNFNGVFLSSSNSRVRSQSLNVGTRVQTFERPGRSRNKSVSFDPEPKVCEFVEFSKKQLKKMRKHERKQTEIAAKKMEAAAKRAGGKNKGGKGGKNIHFFNGFRRESSRSDGSDLEEDKSSEKLNSPRIQTKKSANNDAPKAEAPKSESVGKSSRKSKTKKKFDRKDDRTLNRENRTNSNKEQLTNSLIYELDD